VPDVHTDQVLARFATGAQAVRLRGLRCARGAGIAGWVSVTQKPAVNADPALDVGYRVDEVSPPLRSCLALPILEAGALVAVLGLYRSDANAFADDHVRLMELLAARLSGPMATAIGREQTAAHPTSLTLVRRAAGA
jgi:GAF domain-containing protein